MHKLLLRPKIYINYLKYNRNLRASAANDCENITIYVTKSFIAHLTKIKAHVFVAQRKILLSFKRLRSTVLVKTGTS